MSVRTDIKGGGSFTVNYNEALTVPTAVMVGDTSDNHHEALKVRSTVKAGYLMNPM